MTDDFQTKLINKIKKNFSDEQQKLFLASFYCYLNHHQTKDYVINLDDIWKWLGFSRKNECKKCLTSNFKENNDYIIKNSQKIFATGVDVAKMSGESEKNEGKKTLEDFGIFNPKKNTEKIVNETRGGKNKECVLLNIRTFKKLCMKARTKKADELLDYFIKLEETLHEITEEESKELRNLLLIQGEAIKEKEKEMIAKDKEIQEKNKKLLKLEKEDDGVYSAKKENGDKKIGLSEATNTRISGYKTLEPNLVLEKKISCENRRFAETCVHGILDIQGHRVKKETFNVDNEILFPIMDFVYYMDKLFAYDNFDINMVKKINRHMDDVISNRQIGLVPVKKIIKEENKKDKVVKNVINGSSKGKIVSRNLENGEEIVYNSADQASSACGVSIHTFNKSILDSSRQAFGKHYRSFGEAYWEPPKNFKYEKDNYEPTTKGFIKGSNKDEYYVFESITSAAKILNIDRRKLTDFIDKKRMHEGYVWTKLPKRKWGTYKYSTLDSDKINKEIVESDDEEYIETYDDKLMKIFEFTKNDTDKLLVKELSVIIKSHNIGMSTRCIQKLFIEWGATYHKEKIRVNNVSGIGYKGVKLRGVDRLDHMFPIRKFVYENSKICKKDLYTSSKQKFYDDFHTFLNNEPKYSKQSYPKTGILTGFKKQYPLLLSEGKVNTIKSWKFDCKKVIEKFSNEFE